MAAPAETILDAATTRVRVRRLAPNALRITHAPRLAAVFPADRPWLADVLLSGPEKPPLVAAGEGPANRLHVDVVDGCVRVRTAAGDEVLREAAPAQVGLRLRRASVAVDVPAVEVRRDVVDTTEGVCLCFATEPGEGFYGWGEWFDAFRRERGQVQLKNRDAVAVIQHRATYSGIPIFYSSRGYALWLLNSHETWWTLEPDPGRLEVTAAGPGADYVVIFGPAFRDILATYTALTGRPPLLPRWALGLMVTGYPQEPQPVMIKRVHEHRARDIPLDGLILDYHWEAGYHNFKWRASLFPDPDALIAELRAQGVRLGLIFTPFLNHRNRPGQRRILHALAQNLPPECRHDDERALPEYEAALRLGLLSHPDAKWWFGAGGMLDFANPAAAAWWNAHLRPLYAQGVAFFKNDDGEYLPANGRSAIGLEGGEYHNLYGFYYGRAIYTGMEALDDRRGFVYARSVWAGSQRFPALFLGDQKPTFAHLASALRAGLNLGLLGFAHWTADVFGLDGKTTPELHRRYAQWALLAPVARYFWRPPAVDDTRFPWSHGPANEANFRKYARLRYQLLPFYTALGWEAYLTGLPVLRPMLLEFPGQPALAALDDQAMLGDRLLVAPILAPGDRATGVAQRRVVLPEGGVWHDYWSPASHPGGQAITYTAAPDCLPLLARGGTILPLGPAMPSIPDGHQFDRLSLHCWPPFPAQAVLYDDDGDSRAYQQGAYATTAVRAAGSYAGGQVTVTVAATEGHFAGQAAERQVEVILERAPAAPRAVRVDGELQPPAWAYEAATQRVLARAVCQANRPTQIVFDFQ